MIDEAVQDRSLLNTEAAEWNRDLLLKFKNALEKNPAADLMSLIPASYCRELSYPAQINLRTVNELFDKLKNGPETDLHSAFPKDYAHRI